MYCIAILRVLTRCCLAVDNCHTCAYSVRGNGSNIFSRNFVSAWKPTLCSSRRQQNVNDICCRSSLVLPTTRFILKCSVQLRYTVIL